MDKKVPRETQRKPKPILLITLTIKSYVFCKAKFNSDKEYFINCKQNF